MTLEDIKKVVGIKCSLQDDQGNFVDGVVGEEDIRILANLRWSELHTKFVEKFPDDLEIQMLINLVEDQSDYPVIETPPEGVRITYVGVKYSSSDQYFKRAKLRRFKTLNANDTNSSRYSSITPFYSSMGEQQDASAPSLQPWFKQSIKLYPTPTVDVTDGLLVRLVENPVFMVQDTDEPYTLPNDTAHLIVVYNVIADVWEMKRDWANSNEALNRAVKAEKDFFASYQPTTSDEPVRMGPGKVYNPYGGR